MHNNIIKFCKKFSLITSHPNDDWVKILLLSFLFFVYVLLSGIFLYFDTQSSIDALGSGHIIKKTPPSLPQQGEDELGQTIKVFEEKKSRNTELKNIKPASFPDPIS